MHRITISKNEAQQQWNLSIGKVTLEDSGPYMCQLNTNPIKSQIVFLEVVPQQSGMNYL